VSIKEIVIREVQMKKLLEKALKDELKEKKGTVGTRQVLNSMNKSKLIVYSDSVKKDTLENVEENAKKENVPTLHFEGSSIDLGKLCGLHFRVSSVSLASTSDATIKSILKESEVR